MKQKLIDIIDDFRQQDAPNDNRDWSEHFADHLIENGVIVPNRVSSDNFSFEHGIVVYKHRFSIKRSLNDYEETTLYRCISMSIQHVYKTMACDKLITEMNILYKDDNNKVQCTKLDLHDWTFKVVHKGDMSINI